MHISHLVASTRCAQCTCFMTQSRVFQADDCYSDALLLGHWMHRQPGEEAALSAVLHCNRSEARRCPPSSCTVLAASEGARHTGDRHTLRLIGVAVRLCLSPS